MKNSIPLYNSKKGDFYSKSNRKRDVLFGLLETLKRSQRAALCHYQTKPTRCLYKQKKSCGYFCPPVTRTHTKASKKLQPHDLSVAPGENNTDAVVEAVEPPPFGTSHAIQEVYDEAGVWGFWKGVSPTLIMVSNPSIQFMLYETILKKLKKQRALKGDKLIMESLLWSFCKAWGYCCNISSSRCEGTLDAILKMIRYEGFYGFYKGMSIKIVQSVLATAFLFMVKEEFVGGVRLLLTTASIKIARSKPP